MRVFLLKRDTDGSLLEKVKSSSASYRSVDLYGRRAIIAWPDQEVTSIVDDDVEGIVDRKSYALSSRQFKPEDTAVTVGRIVVGRKRAGHAAATELNPSEAAAYLKPSDEQGGVVVAAGPCSVEDEATLHEAAEEVKRAGAQMLRGGAFKPRTSPYSFTGLGEKGLRMLARERELLGMPVVSEVLDVRTLPLFQKANIDMLQVGTRNSQNFPLLEALGDTGKPVLLKRGMENTLEEWLSAADYVLSRGNGNVVLCERGIRTFESSTRFALDVGSLAAVKRESHLPVCADPSHPAGKREFVEPLALAAVAAGADMLLIEVHPRPEEALSDPDQQLTPREFRVLMERVRALETALRAVEGRLMGSSEA